ncbi:polysaccharide deacetylase family protein [Flavobacterium enshiense]|uniref:polysaccharide deacetylase family protein n=1 Tax=Flavobacterium enshiense TaxID=1341165 RepID=UPI00138B0E28|nr:polysaccharide deacetylase family protein [Flavobacterium enshiense]
MILISPNSYGQSVAITIDDVPNIKNNLLSKLDSLSIPIAIFINEGKIYKSETVDKNHAILENWIKRHYITIGNHTFNHSRYSEVGINSFKIDIEKGTLISLELAKKYNKKLKYFRFPYNDLGHDSIQHKQIANYLISKKYIITPFTIESIDWMYNSVYEYYLKQDDKTNADKIGNAYVQKTLELFNYFEKIGFDKYHRNISQIYLCHDNQLNTDYLPVLINELKNKKYKFISLEKALKDKIYSQTDNYNKKWGISWMYRWLHSKEELKSLQTQEPSTEEIENIYHKTIEKSKS